MKIIKIIYYNFLVFLALIILIEIFFGYWFKDENFGIYMRKERKINWQTSSSFNGKEYNFSYKRNYWGFRGEDFDPKKVQIITGEYQESFQKTTQHVLSTNDFFYFPITELSAKCHMNSFDQFLDRILD